MLHSTNDNGGAGFDPPTGGGSSLPFLGRHASAQSLYPFSYDSIRVYDEAIGGAPIAAIYADEVAFFDDLPSRDIEQSDLASKPVGVVGNLYRAVESGPNSLRVDSGFFR
jgi:hypothetical protein